MSWNVDWQVIIDRTKGHAPRERVSWNFNSCAVTILQWCHAPRERVSWNRVVHGWAGQRLVTLHVSVWVEIEEEMLRVSMGESRSTWACELKFIIDIMINYNSTSRSTWACELKCRSSSSSVSRPVVTLHVSVWVEISLRSTSRTRKKVTLHVSVWVEISLTVVGSQLRMSRSTWACELKFSTYLCCKSPQGSRSTWACELKSL